MFDIRGRLVHQQEFKQTSQLNETVNLRSVQSGMYILYLSDDTRTYARRIAVK